MITQYHMMKRAISIFVVAKNIIRTDQPGRILAVFLVSPILAYKGIQYQDAFIKAFSLTLFSWDLYWLMMKPAVTLKNS